MKIKNNKGTKIYLFDKGAGFTVLSEKSAIQQIQEHLRQANIAENDPKLTFTNKIEEILCRLRKGKKFTDRKYFQLCLSELIPPQLYCTTKTQKSRKNYSMRTIVSTKATQAMWIIQAPRRNNTTNTK